MYLVFLPRIKLLRNLLVSAEELNSLVIIKQVSLTLISCAKASTLRPIRHIPVVPTLISEPVPLMFIINMSNPVS